MYKCRVSHASVFTCVQFLSAYLNRKDNFAEDELLQDLENYIAERGESGKMNTYIADN